MTLFAVKSCSALTHYFLGFEKALHDAQSVIPDQPQCLLELVFDADNPVADYAADSTADIGYWKIALSVADLHIARSKLIDQQVEVSEPCQVPEVAYLCHCEDPDGYCIEFIQHRFQHNHDDQAVDTRFALGTSTTFSLITYRVKDPQSSIDFYRHHFGFRLISRQLVAHRGFTLYFLSCANEEPPSSDIENIEMREWLWQRPYAMVELQHIWGSETDADFTYNTDSATGFRGIRLLARHYSSAGAAAIFDPVFQYPTITATDPDGYNIQVIVTG